MPKFAPPPPVAPETWRALLAAAADFAALEAAIASLSRHMLARTMP